MASCYSKCTIPYTTSWLLRRSCTYGNLKMIDIRRLRFFLASIEISVQNSRQLNAIAMMSWFNSKCYDFSLVKITIKDLIRASRSSEFGSS